VLGIGRTSKTVENLLRDGQCVLNLPSSDMVSVVDKLALTTGKAVVPEWKDKMGFKYIKNKFETACLTPVPSEMVTAPRALECPIQLEATAVKFHKIDLGTNGSFAYAIETHILKMHIEETLLSDEKRHYVDTDKWKPLIMSFCEFYELGEKVHPSRLAKVF
jgi:flavin reductase (DIM6/NTAB) family NADH-FMN oxidoreductase RutF